MTERGPIFDAAREAYEAARGRLLGLIDNPLSGESVADYWSQLKAAQKASNDAHSAMMEAWG